MADPITFDGTVEWSFENPGVSLKEVPDGRFVVLASFFRVVLSPHGRGHALVLLQSPNDASPRPEQKTTASTTMRRLRATSSSTSYRTSAPIKASQPLGAWSTGGSIASRLQAIRPVATVRRS